jgi:hypothetical protein
LFPTTSSQILIHQNNGISAEAKKETLVQKNVHPKKETLVQGAYGAAQGHVQH